MEENPKFREGDEIILKLLRNPFKISASSPKNFQLNLFENDGVLRFPRQDRKDDISVEGSFGLFMSSCKTVRRQAIPLRGHFVKEAATSQSGQVVVRLLFSQLFSQGNVARNHKAFFVS